MSRRVDPPLVRAAARLRDRADGVPCPAGVAHVYNPLRYAWPVHRAYVSRYGAGEKRVLFLGMNPGPFGMAQTGVPFGEVAAVRDWMGLRGRVGKPAHEHEKRPVEGWDCPRSEVSGRRLWGLFAGRFGPAEVFFRDHFVVNYCPLAFLSDRGANVTPDQVRGGALEELFAACDEHLREVIDVQRPRHLVGIGRFAADRLTRLETGLPVVSALHPSPASPSANRDWAALFTRQLKQHGVWS